MNPYLGVTLAMCVIGALSLAATAYLAMMFNRRAKADLTAALQPLADVVGGTLDLDRAEVEGRYGGHLVFGRMANATEGHGRVFQVDVMDPAGGAAWRWTSVPGRNGAPTSRAFSADEPALERSLRFDWNAILAAGIDPATERHRFEYDPTAGWLRFSRPMRTRRDIPNAPSFRAQLDALIGAAEANRTAQQVGDGAPAAVAPPTHVGT